MQEFQRMFVLEGSKTDIVWKSLVQAMKLLDPKD